MDIQELQSFIESGQLKTLISASTDWDDILDQRDRPEFESFWMRCFDKIETEWNAREVPPESAALVGNLRRDAFLSVSRATNNHEIAAYVSDDFDLIGRGLILGSNLEGCEKLWNSYQQGQIPA